MIFDIESQVKKLKKDTEQFSEGRNKYPHIVDCLTCPIKDCHFYGKTENFEDKCLLVKKEKRKTK